MTAKTLSFVCVAVVLFVSAFVSAPAWAQTAQDVGSGAATIMGRVCVFPNGGNDCIAPGVAFPGAQAEVYVSGPNGYVQDVYTSSGDYSVTVPAPCPSSPCGQTVYYLSFLVPGHPEAQTVVEWAGVSSGSSSTVNAYLNDPATIPAFPAAHLPRGCQAGFSCFS